MKNFLMTTTMLAGIALGSAAFAQTTNSAGVPMFTWTNFNGAQITGTYAEFVTGLGSAPLRENFAVGSAGDALFAAATDTYNTAVANTTASLAQNGADVAPYTPNSLLDNLLSNATDLQASLTNVAENLNDVNGSINVATDRSLANMALVIDQLNGTTNVPFGSFSTVGTNVFGQDLPAALLEVLNPTVLALGDLSTTAIGAMQSGSITATIDADGILDRASSAATGASTSADLMAETYGSIGNTVAIQNIANNAGAIDGSVNLALADVNATIGKVATTAIGAMGSGSLTATISGNMNGVNNTSAAIINALVGNTN